MEMIGTHPLMVMTFIVDSDASACTSNDFPHPEEKLHYVYDGFADYNDSFHHT